MTNARRWTDRTRILAEVALLACCAIVTTLVRAIVDRDTLSYPTELALNSAALVTLLASISLSFVLIRKMTARSARASASLASLALVCLAIAFVRLAYADVSIELADLIEPAEAAEGPSQIVVGPTGTDVRLSGDIKAGAADLLKRLLDAHPAIRRIHLTSEGGLAEEGQAVAEVIAAHRLTTYVPDFCVSACTLAFVGGRERILMDGARLGFHAPYREGVFGQTFAGDAREQRADYIAAGLSAEFVDRALKVAPEDIWIPERDQLLAAHVITGTVGRYQYPDSILDGAADGQGARDAVLRNFPMLASIDTASPPAVDRIADWYLHAYRRGASEGESTDGLKTIVGATIVLVLLHADDATLLDLGRFIKTAMDAEPSPRECVAIGDGVDLVRAAAVLGDTDTRARGLVARALASGRAGPPAPRITSVALAPRAETCASLRRAYGDAVRHGDATALRRRLQEEAPKAARRLAVLVAGERR